MAALGAEGRRFESSLPDHKSMTYGDAAGEHPGNIGHGSGPIGQTSHGIVTECFPALSAVSAVTAEMRRLIIAARIVAFTDNGATALIELQEASEAFASIVPWDDEPEAVGA